VTLPQFQPLLEFGPLTAAAALFLLLSLALEAGYLVGRQMVIKRQARTQDASGIFTLTSGLLVLFAFALSLSISFAQNRCEARRDLVLAEANAIETAWLRTNLIDGDEGPMLAAKIEDYAKARLEFTIATSSLDIPAMVARTNALQDDIRQITQLIAYRSPDPVTTALVTALNDMFDLSASQRFAYITGVPNALMLALCLAALLASGTLGYQFGLAGRRQVVLSSLLLMMWSGGMLLIVDLSQPRIGEIRVEAEPLVWTIQRFDQK
jgi:hypothetical protein